MTRIRTYQGHQQEQQTLQNPEVKKSTWVSYLKPQKSEEKYLIRKKRVKGELTSTVGGGRGGDFAGGGERHGLSHVESDTHLSATLESLTETGSISFENCLESSAASPFRLLCLAVVGDKRQAVGHVEDQGGAVHGRGGGGAWGGGVGGGDGEEEESEGKGEC